MGVYSSECVNIEENLKEASREMAQQLRAHTTLAEYWSSVPTAYIRELTTPGDPMPLAC